MISHTAAVLKAGLRPIWPRLIVAVEFLAALAVLLPHVGTIEGWYRPAARHRRVAMHLRAQHNYARAAQEYREALKYEPRDGLAAHGLIATLVLERRYEEARGACRRRLAIEPRDAEAEGWLACLAGVLGDNDEVLAAAQRAAQIEPHDAQVLLALGDALWRVGRRGEARGQWSAVTRMSSPEAAAVARDRLRRIGG